MFGRYIYNIEQNFVLIFGRKLFGQPQISLMMDKCQKNKKVRHPYLKIPLKLIAALTNHRFLHLFLKSKWAKGAHFKIRQIQAKVVERRRTM